MASDPADALRDLGFVFLRAAIDPGPLSAEMDRVALDAFGDDQAVRHLQQGTATVTFRYVPMMGERTPVSLGLLDRFSGIAADILGRTVLPGRAKGTWYYGDTGWHRDSEHDVPSLGFVAYLEPVTATTGALRVVAGSHADRAISLQNLGSPDPSVHGEAIDTVPGDVIVFDEHLIHGSTGGGERRQWRVDFVIDPVDADEEAGVRAWFGQSVPDERQECGYDAERYPSYGPHWQARDRPWTKRLHDLGVY